MPMKVGRVRQAIHMAAATATVMIAPNTTNINARVTSEVVKTSVLSTDANHSQSV